MTFDPQTILNNVLAELPERSRDVIVSRFGIGKSDSETLESIGQRYGITRERVRQIEADALKTIKERRTQEHFSDLVGAVESFVRKNGGVVDERMARRIFAKNYFNTKSPREWEGFVDLIFAIGDQFKKASASDIFSERWYLSHQNLEKQEKVAKKVVEFFKERDDIKEEAELVSFVQSVEPELSKEAVISYVTACTAVKANVYGQWGLKNWPEIRPRGVKDKAHLVMKAHGEPLHFTGVADLINKTGFSNRKALPQTVHNELIKDKRFVLVGRGLYALKEWGYEEGTVRDIIRDELQKKGPLHKDELVEAVLARRFVKPSTVVLNLNQFKKTDEGKYTLA